MRSKPDGAMPSSTTQARPVPDRPAMPRSHGEVIRAWVQWIGLARMLVTGIAVVAVAGGGYWLLRSAPTPVENTLPFASTSSVAAAGTSGVESTGGAANGSTTESPIAPADESTSTTTASSIVVYVAGAVAVAGVYEVPRGSRMQQAVAAAGGLTTEADTDAVNLAAPLVDGDRVYVPRIGVAVPPVVSPGGGGSGQSDPQLTVADAPIDLNRASAVELDELPGVGPSTALAIVEHRESHGPFAAVEDLLDVRGIGPAKLDAIRDLVDV